MHENQTDLAFAFLVLTAVVRKWDDGIFFSQFLDYLTILDRFGQDISFVARLFHGRAFPARDRQFKINQSESLFC
jgi:hypothetical protein